MLYPLDIFKINLHEGVLWRGAAETWVAAKACIKELAVASPGEYFIFDHRTRGRVFVKPEVSDNYEPASNRAEEQPARPPCELFRPYSVSFGTVLHSRTSDNFH